MKKYRRTAVLDLLRRQGPVTREDLIRHTGVSSATAGRLVAALIDEGLVRRAGREPTGRRGRQKTLLDINNGYGTLIGMEIKMDRVVAVLCDFRGAVRKEMSVPFDPEALAGEGRSLSGVLIDSARDLLDGNDVTPATVKGIGIAIPGQIDRAAGTVVSFPHVARWAGTPVAEPVGAAMGVPCRILPNAPSVALGEREFGLAKGVSHALCIGVAENVTMGIVCNGEVVFGCSGNAGELGHIALGDPAERCYCGATGCLETAATTLVLVREARRALADGVDSVLSSTPTVDAHYIIDAARKNDRLAVDLVEAMIQRLAGALVVTVNIFNPEVIILNGVLSDAADLFMDSLQRIIHRSAVSEAGAAVTLKVSELGGTAGALGATIPIVERVFAEV